MSIQAKLLFLISSTMGLLIIALSLVIVAIPKGGIIVALMLVLSLIGLVFNKERTRLDKREKYFFFSFCIINPYYVFL
jgi:archaellum biogenesis protein FlaJ (TadC family)